MAFRIGWHRRRTTAPFDYQGTWPTWHCPRQQTLRDDDDQLSAAADDVPPAAAEVPPAAADVPPAAAQVPPDAADVTPAEEEYTVKCIHDQQGTGRWTKYLVEWEGYEGERTWEPAAHLTDTAALTAWKRHRNQ